jgi:predicted negative regulator of RcsB-dependent stress response
MAEAYRTEEEQVEAIKKWWKENGMSTVVSIVIAIALVFGWQGWQKSQQGKKDAASVMYQNLVTVANSNNGNLTDEQKATAKHLAETLKTDFPGSTYAQFAAFYSAKFAVEAKDLETAESQLRWVIDNKPGEEFLIQAQLRLARVVLAKDDYEQALQLLNRDAKGYAGAYEEVKGDVYRAQGDTDLAISAYEQAVQINQRSEKKTQNPLLDMKIQQLKSERGSVAALEAKEG